MRKRNLRDRLIVYRAWEKPEHVDVYRKVPEARYYEYRHDRDPDQGWIELKK